MAHLQCTSATYRVTILVTALSMVLTPHCIVDWTTELKYWLSSERNDGYV